MGDTFIITRGGLAATSLTTASFLWLHEEAWDAEQKAAFHRFRTAPPLRLYAPPPASRSKSRRVPPKIFGKWLLTQPGGTPLAVAEAHVLQASFCSLWLFIGSSGERGWGDAPLTGGLTLLVSALILLSEADQVRLVSLRPGRGELEALGLGGECRTLWTPYESLARLTGPFDRSLVSSILLDPVAWWSQPFAADDRKTLSYLERRLAAPQPACPLPRRRHPWWRLFR